MSGFSYRLLQVDLGRREINILNLDPDWAGMFIGGRGLGTKILWEWQKPGLDPCAPEAFLLFLTGPLTGLVPGGAQTCVVFKSPATEVTIGHSLFGGHWGAELRAAGFEGLLLRGQSETPIYLYVNNGKVEIKDAQGIWGLGTRETEEQIRKELGDPLARVACIGPAGENLVNFASIQHELFHSAARGGAGKMMGLKKIKAIAVRGKQALRPAEEERFFKARSEAERILLDSRYTTQRGYYLSRWGSTISSIPHSDISELDIRNYREGYWEDIDSSGGLELERRCWARARGCFSCPIGCFQIGILHEGPNKGFVVNPDFDSSGTIGPGCLVKEAEEVAYLSRLGDELGLDDASLGNVTGFAIECFEKGIITKEDLDGLELRWGDAQVIKALWIKIVRQEGIGSLLAQGVKKAAERLGKGSSHFAMHVKGLEFAGYAPQAHPDRALQYAVGDRGGCHHYGLTLEEQNQRAWADSTTHCSWHHAFIKPEHYLELLSAATGVAYHSEDWELVAERILTLARAYNIREGMVPLRDDTLPERVHSEPLSWGPKAGITYPRQRLAEDREKWYLRRGYDRQGYPTEERLNKLGLEFTEKALREARSRFLEKEL